MKPGLILAVGGAMLLASQTNLNMVTGVILALTFGVLGAALDVYLERR